MVREMRDNPVTIACPSRLTEPARKECVALIANGGAVDRAYVEQWFPLSVVVAVKWSGAEVVGVGVIKPARPHTATVARESGFELPPKMHELGYITVKDEHQGQGISRALVKALHTAHEAPLYATTSNERMRSTLRRFGFEPRGNEWRGNEGSMLSLWVRFD